MAIDERLRLIAEALGFDETTKSVDALRLAQEKLAATNEKVSAARGPEGTVADLSAALQEQRQLSEAVQVLGGNVDDATLSFGQLLEVVKVADPRLAGFASRLLRVSESFGDLGAKNVTLAGSFEGLLGFVSKNVNALALLGAAGAVVAGIYAIISAVSKMREEFEKATAAIERQSDALTEAKDKSKEQQASIEGLADSLRGGGFSAEESRRAQGLAARARQRFPQLDESAVNQAVAGLGPGASIEDVEDAAFLIQSGRLDLRKGERRERFQARFGRVRGRFGGDVAAFREREVEQARETISGARTEAIGEPGSESDLRSLGLSDEDIALLRRFPTRGALEAARHPSFLRPRGSGLTYTDIASLERSFDLLDRGRTPSSTVIQHNVRNYGPDADAQRRRESNGASTVQRDAVP